MADRSSGEKQRFYPEYLSEVLAVIFLILFAVYVLAVLYSPPLGREINFVSAYQPKPEWYFLWLYELIRYFPGRLSVLGSVLVPAAAFLLFALIPFIDDGTVPARRRAVLVMALLLAAMTILTAVPVLLP